MRLFPKSLVLVTTCTSLVGLLACSPKVDTYGGGKKTGAGSAQQDDNNTSSGNAGSGGVDPKSAANRGSEAGKDHFDGKMVAAFRDSSENCLSCHDAPRNILGVPDAADQALYDYDKMFSLLKKGEFSNDNEFINPMLGKTDHPGAQICTNEQSPLCALAIEWYKLEFEGGGASSAGLLEGVDLITTTHVVKGYAKDIDNPDQKLTVKIYMDGDKDNGTLVGEGVADRFQDTDIGRHAFAISVPEADLDNRSRQIYAYAVKGGEEQLLSGSPVNFLSVKQNDRFPGLNALVIRGCNCHTPAVEFTYDTLWPDLATPSNPNQPLGPTNNKGYEFTQAGSDRASRHAAGAQGDPNAYISWWCAEFDVDNNTPGCN